ncbi:MAG: TrmB family transcriptional regulator [Candidatus Helarchaeota archaeon]
MQIEHVEISENIIDAFKLLGTNRHVAECYTFLLVNNDCTLDQIQAQFHRKMKNLEILLEKGWVKEEPSKAGIVYRSIPPDAVLGNRIKGLASQYKQLEGQLNVLRTARVELKVMYEKGITNIVLNTPDEFYGWQSEMCDKAKKSICAVTDRWMLALLRKNELANAIRRGVKVRVLGRIKDPDSEMVTELKRRANELMEIGVKIRLLKEVVRIRFMLIDEESIFFAIRKHGEKHKGTWIKSPDFVRNFVEEMNVLWKNSDNPEDQLDI